MTKYQGTPLPPNSRSERRAGSRAPGHGHARDRSPQFGICRIGQSGFPRLPENLQDFRTGHPSGTGAWEAAIVNTLSPGDKVLMVETGHFAILFSAFAGGRHVTALLTNYSCAKGWASETPQLFTGFYPAPVHKGFAEERTSAAGRPMELLTQI